MLIGKNISSKIQCRKATLKKAVKKKIPNKFGGVILFLLWWGWQRD
jgi:hypothetical protein